MAYRSVRILADLIENMVGQGGTNRDRVNRTLVYDILNMKAQELARRTGIQASSVTFTTAGDLEVELPADVINLTEVWVDDYEAHKINHADLKAIQGQIS